MVQTLTLPGTRSQMLSKVRCERAKRSFAYTVKALHPEWEIPTFHTHLMTQIQAWARAEEPYGLLLELPPGHSKSTYARLAVAWMMGADPSMHVAYVSYGQDLADEHSGLLQAEMMSEEYAELFPGTQLNDRRVVTDERAGARRTKDLFDVVGTGGQFRAVGVGGSLTGFRCDAIVIDDPLKGAKEASSATIREDQWRWYTRVASTRRRPGRPLRFLMLLTRWHLDDLAGRALIHQAGHWKEVCMPALATAEPTPQDPRSPGEALWPLVATRDELEDARRLDPEGFQALYQGRPVPDGGAIFKASWLEARWDHLPARPGTWLQSWDMRAGGKSSATSSYCVGQLWWKPHDTAIAYLVDQVRGRWSPDETLAQFDAMQRIPTWRDAKVRLVEEKADGIMVHALRRETYPGMLAIQPQGSKEDRVRAVTPLCRAGNLRLPQSAPWLPDLEAELLTFPAAAHDDQVDALSQAMAYFFLQDTDDQTASRAWRAMMGG